MNRLADETSPYLLQHRHNPVHWYPWGEEALARAKAEDRPIFLSIGYSACHWCHVMEHESFEKPEIAELMNRYFVNIKVDREERPDLDDIYMTAVQRMTGAGGWPMSMWLTPDLKPFFGGTYYPPEDRYGRPGFPKVLEHVHKLWTERRADVEKASNEMVEELNRLLRPESKPGDPSLDWIAGAARFSAERFDEEYGGFGQAPQFAPKFPHASELSVLLRHHARTGDATSLKIATTTLDKMALGGIYDQLAGGFHRYTVDRAWLVPHFEKMLYDNALLARTYTEAWQLTGKELYATIARETLDYLMREMRDASGGFYSSTDADSEGVEGKFFVWSKAAVDALLGDDAALACARWGITEGGNWEHNNILTAAKTPAEVAAQFEISEADVVERLRGARAKLLAARAERIPPGTDDKVLAAWNGMAIAALAVAHQAFGEPRYLEAAQRAAGFVLTDMRREGRLLRTWRKGEARLAAYLEDYGFVAEGLTCLFESDFDPRWLLEAKALLADVREHFEDESGGSFFFTADDHEKLVTRNKSISESSIPSGVAMVVRALLRVGLLTGDREFEAAAERAMRTHHAEVSRFPLIAPALLLCAELHLGDPREIVIVGEPDDPVVLQFLAGARRVFPPHQVVTLVHSGNRDALLAVAPFLDGKGPVGGKAAAYVCRRGVCEAPVVDPVLLPLGK